MKTEHGDDLDAVGDRVRTAVQHRHRQLAADVVHAERTAAPVTIRRHERRPALQFLAACLVIVALVASGVVWATRDRGTEGTNLDTVATEPTTTLAPPKPLLYFWPQAGAEGLRIDNVDDGLSNAAPPPPRWTQVFADEDATHVLSLMMSLDPSKPQPWNPPNATSVKVGSYNATLYEQPDRVESTLDVTLPCGLATMWGRAMTGAELLAAAASIRCEVRPITAPYTAPTATIDPPIGFTRRYDKQPPFAHGMSLSMTQSTSANGRAPGFMNVNTSQADDLEQVWLLSGAAKRRTLSEGGRTYLILESEMSSTNNGVAGVEPMYTLAFVEDGTAVYVDGVFAAVETLVLIASSLERVDEATFRRNVAALRESWDQGMNYILDPVPDGITVRVTASRGSTNIQVGAPPASGILGAISINFIAARFPATTPGTGHEVRDVTTKANREVKAITYDAPAPGPSPSEPMTTFRSKKVEWVDGDVRVMISAGAKDVDAATDQRIDALMLELVDALHRVDLARFETFRQAHS